MDLPVREQHECRVIVEALEAPHLDDVAAPRTADDERLDRTLVKISK
jgi:hypothetical protein